MPETLSALSPGELKRLGRAIPRRLRFTRDGKLLFVVTLGIGFGAVNSGNNLLYLVLGVLLSLIMVSGVLSELTLRRLTATRSPSNHLQVGEPSLVRVDVHNGKRHFSTLSVEVTELVGPGYGLEQRRGFLLGVPREGSTAAHLRLVCHRRGLIPTGGLRLTTRFPFGFFEKSRFIPLPGHYLVVPRVRPVPLPPLSPQIRGAEEEIARIGQGDEFYALRDAHAGDDARSIAWKVTARRDKLTVREHQRPATRRVLLVIANIVPPGDAGVVERLEEAFSEVASLAAVLVEEGYAVGLSTADGGVSPQAGAGALTAILEHLAMLPVREVAPGTRVPLFLEGSWGSVERYAVVTLDQERAGYPVEADHVSVLNGDPGEDQA